MTIVRKYSNAIERLLFVKILGEDMKSKFNIFMILIVIGAMILVACDGSIGETIQTGESSEQAEVSGEEKVLYVGSELVDCEGEGPQKCMLIKESLDGEYQLFYSQIEGFEFEPGYEYELKVRVEDVENPPAGGSSLKYTLIEEVSKTPAAAETGEMTGQDEGDVVTMYVGPELADCVGVGPQECMLVKYSPEEEYQYFYNQIEGFTYEPGYEYELQVLVTPIENPPADGSSLKYTLVEVVSQTPAGTSTESGEGETSLTGMTWALKSYADADGNMVEVLPRTEITAVFGEDGSLGGSSGCNNFNTSYEVDGSNISISEMIAATMMACPEPVMQQETAFLANLSSAATFEISDDTLT
jgi:heat shock protein HslJ